MEGTGSGYFGFNAPRVGHELEDLGLGLFEGGAGDVGHEDAGALLGEEDGGLETDAPGEVSSLSCRGVAASLPAGAGDDGVLAC